MLENDSATGGTPRGEGESEQRPTTRRAEKKPVCGFCETILTPSGDIFDELSAKAKKLRDAKQEADDLRTRLQTANERVTELETQLADARRQPEPETVPPAPKKGLYI